MYHIYFTRHNPLKCKTCTDSLYWSQHLLVYTVFQVSNYLFYSHMSLHNYCNMQVQCSANKKSKLCMYFILCEPSCLKLQVGRATKDTQCPYSGAVPKSAPKRQDRLSESSASYSVGSMDTFFEAKRPWPEARHSSLLNAKVLYLQYPTRFYVVVFN